MLTGKGEHPNPVRSLMVCKKCVAIKGGAFMVKWKEIHINGLNYKVSDIGNVVGKNKELKQRFTKDGYKSVTVGRGAERTLYLVHRLVALLFVINENNLPEVNHKDANKSNNDYNNLEWVTHKENMEHASNKKLFNDRKGINNSKSKITEKQVLEIRELYNRGIKSPRISLMYGITKESVMNIVRKITWSHI